MRISVTQTVSLRGQADSLPHKKPYVRVRHFLRYINKQKEVNLLGQPLFSV